MTARVTTRRKLEAAFQSLAAHTGRRVSFDATVTMLAVASRAPRLALLPHLPRRHQVAVTRESLSFPERAELGLLLARGGLAFTAEARAFLLDVLRRPRLVRDVLADAQGTSAHLPALGVVLAIEPEGVRLVESDCVPVGHDGRFGGEAMGVPYTGRVMLDGHVTLTMRGFTETTKLQTV